MSGRQLLQRPKRKTHVVTERPPFERIALLLQGGGALDGEFTTTDDVVDAVLFFADAKTKALTGRSLIVSHGWVME